MKKILLTMALMLSIAVTAQAAEKDQNTESQGTQVTTGIPSGSANPNSFISSTLSTSIEKNIGNPVTSNLVKTPMLQEVVPETITTTSVSTVTESVPVTTTVTESVPVTTTVTESVPVTKTVTGTDTTTNSSTWSQFYKGDAPTYYVIAQPTGTTLTNSNIGSFLQSWNSLGGPFVTASNGVKYVYGTSGYVPVSSIALYGSPVSLNSSYNAYTIEIPGSEKSSYFAIPGIPYYTGTGFTTATSSTAIAMPTDGDSSAALSKTVSTIQTRDPSLDMSNYDRIAPTSSVKNLVEMPIPLSSSDKTTILSTSNANEYVWQIGSLQKYSGVEVNGVAGYLTTSSSTVNSLTGTTTYSTSQTNTSTPYFSGIQTSTVTTPISSTTTTYQTQNVTTTTYQNKNVTTTTYKTETVSVPTTLTKTSYVTKTVPVTVTLTIPVAEKGGSQIFESQARKILGVQTVFKSVSSGSGTTGGTTVSYGTPISVKKITVTTGSSKIVQKTVWKALPAPGAPTLARIHSGISVSSFSNPISTVGSLMIAAVLPGHARAIWLGQISPRIPASFKNSGIKNVPAHHVSTARVHV